MSRRRQAAVAAVLCAVFSQSVPFAPDSRVRAADAGDQQEAARPPQPPPPRGTMPVLEPPPAPPLPAPPYSGGARTGRGTG